MTPQTRSSLGRSIATAFPMMLAAMGSGGCSSNEDSGAGDGISTSSGTPGGTTGTSTATGTVNGETVASSSVAVTTASVTVASATSATSTTSGSTTSAGGATGMSSGSMGGASTSAGGTSSSTGDGGGGGGGSGGTGTGGTGTGGTGTGGTGTGGVTDPNSPGCGAAISRPDRNVQQTLETGGVTRYYLLDVPENADNQTPLMLIFALHGFDMNNVAVKDLYNFTQRSNGQAITVMPQGEGPPPGDVSHWGDGVLESTWSPNEANYDFIQALTTTLGESYCIDTSRVFIVGFSMGAFFTNAIACDRNDWFRGFAPIAGGGPSACGDDIEAAIMVQHGTADLIVDDSSGEASRDTWIEQNGCSSSSMSSFKGCESYEGCSEGKPVVWCTGNYDHYIPEDVTANIWSFFSGL